MFESFINFSAINIFSCFQVFNPEQEEALVAYAIKCCKHYFGLSIIELKQLAYEFAQKVNVKYPPSWDRLAMAGKQWYYGFMMRHNNLCLRTPEQTSIHRVKGFSRENVGHFFTNLEAVLADYPFGPSAIWNMDESGFSTVPTRMGKTISLQGMKRVGQIVSAERGSMITLAFAVSAAGNCLPPFYLFPRKKMSPLYLEHASKESVGYANESGWMTAQDFIKFLQHYIKYTRCSKSAPTLLLLDNHGSHLSVEAIDLAVENGITMLSFPPHCSHRLQPLDVSVFGPVKGVYNKLHNSWMRENAGRALEILHIPMLVKTALLKGATAENIVSGFKATGISPFNPHIFSDTDFISLGEDDVRQEAAAIEAQYSEENQRRIIYQPIQVSAHESVSLEQPISTGSLQDSKYSSLISSIGPLQIVKPRKKSNRGPKPKKTTILTSPENLINLKQQQQKRETARVKKELAVERKKSAVKNKVAVATRKEANQRKKTAKNAAALSNRKKNASSDQDGRKICLVCLKKLPSKRTAGNVVKCLSCEHFIHTDCVANPTEFTLCPNCNSYFD